MNAISRWDPVQELEQFQNRVLSAFRPMGGRTNGDGDGVLAAAQWVPSVNISENEKEYLVCAELPEIPPKDVKVTLESGVLTISGERKSEEDTKNHRHHLVERSYGRFVRSFTLPNDIDPDQVDAQFRDGMLKVRISKSEQAKPKQIEIRTGN